MPLKVCIGGGAFLDRLLHISPHCLVFTPRPRIRSHWWFDLDVHICTRFPRFPVSLSLRLCCVAYLGIGGTDVYAWVVGTGTEARIGGVYFGVP